MTPAGDETDRVWLVSMVTLPPGTFWVIFLVWEYPTGARSFLPILFSQVEI